MNLQTSLFKDHKEHAEKQKLSVPCCAHHVNFGGGCLNCGWTPSRPPLKAEDVK